MNIFLYELSHIAYDLPSFFKYVCSRGIKEKVFGSIGIVRQFGALLASSAATVFPFHFSFTFPWSFGQGIRMDSG